MYKFVLTRDGNLIREYALKAKQISIGRDQSSDITLNDASVSRHHARLVRVLDSYYLEDLDSTNGTQRNLRQITKHILKHGDEIRIGGFVLHFLEESKAKPDGSEVQPGASAEGGEPTPDDAAATAISGRVSKPRLPKTARLRFFRGPNVGRTEILGRGLYTIGKPGEEVAAIARRPQGFFLLPIGGDRPPRINNSAVTSIAGVKLNEADVVEVGDNLAEITFTQEE